MPELPEVEASRKMLEEHCAGRKITGCSAIEAGGHARDGEFDAIVIDDADASAESVATALKGKTLVGVRRRGKQLLLEMSSPPHLLGHFGMTGAFVIKGVAPLKFQEFKVHDAEWPPRFTKLELTFGGDVRLAFCDPRRLGRLRLRSDPEHQDPWRALAPDALLDLPSIGAFTDFLAGTSSVIKALLLDQNKLVSGVGNWVADEVLFQAGIHPESPCDTLSENQVAALHTALQDVLTTAVSCNANASGFPDTWLFHYRWGKGANGTKVPGANGGAISFSTVGGRTSAIVLARQKKGERKGGGGEKAKAKKEATTAKKRGKGKTSPYFAEEAAAAAEPPAEASTAARGSKKRARKE